MYRAPLPRTKPQSPLPDAVFTGWIEAGGRGPRSPAGAAWSATTGAPSTPSGGCGCTALAFAEAPGAWLDVVLGRVRVGRVLTPWVANGALALDGRRYRLGGLAGAPRVDARAGRSRGRRWRARARRCPRHVASPEGQTVAFRYADPAGGEHVALNCSIAEMHLRVERSGRPA